MLPDGDCSHEIKRRLLFERKAMTNLDSVLKSRDITLPTKVHLVKAMVFPVVMYECESWTIKKTECWRTVAFELWCWRRLLRVSWTARRSNQSILKKISPGCSLERHAEAETPILWPPDVKNWLIEKDPDAGTDWRQEEKGTAEDEMVGWHHWLDGHGFGWAPGVDDGQGGRVCCGSWGLKESDMTEQLNWTELTCLLLSPWVVSDSLWPHEPDSLPGSSFHGIFQARIWEWVAFSFSRGSSKSRDQTHISCVSCITGGFFICWAIREAH